MLFLLVLLAALVVLGVVLAVVVIKWLFILAVVAALIWVFAFFSRGISRRPSSAYAEACVAGSVTPRGRALPWARSSSAVSTMPPPRRKYRQPSTAASTRKTMLRYVV